MTEAVLKMPQAKEARRLYEEQGLSLPQLATRYGCSRQAVGTAIKAVGGTLRTPLQGRLRRWEQIYSA